MAKQIMEHHTIKKMYNMKYYIVIKKNELGLPLGLLQLLFPFHRWGNWRT